MRRPHDRLDLLEPDPGGTIPGEGVPTPGDPALTAALERCAAGDRSGVDELRAWQGGRLRDVLLRILGEENATDRVLDAVLDDLFRNAPMVTALGRAPAEDRVFGLLRRHAYAALRQGTPTPSRPAPPIRPAPNPVVTAAPPSPAPPPAPKAAVPPTPPAPLPPYSPEPVAAPEPQRPALVPAGVVTPLEPAPTPRRPGTPDELAPVHFEDDEDEWEEPSRWRGWLRVALAWLLACAIGFAVAYLASLVLNHQAELFEAEEAPPSLASPPPPVEVPAPAAPETPTAEPPPDEPSPRELLGAPLEAPEPPPVTVDPPREPPPEPAAPPSAPRSVKPAPAADAPSAAAPLPSQARVFIHHSASDRAAAARATTLASRLLDQGASVVAARPVPFGIRGLSVRYFHPGDRDAAAQVLEVTKVALDEEGADAPSSPADFTSFSPAPRFGTIEVWLPGG
jgi:hypothetical protein